ncbi:MAG: dihydrodipicolinate synthase family protein [Verrucomicrobiales bacterium]|jgi:4-hydroxy-tetrahydrodipicolinate synthase|nr:dihydrodipicolinate synthase family protein [Verrucomicrobiales bacterium]MDF1786861.1 dihydrodipicolinate synthase family protein [Verrucomicrobiales bacterium]
MNNDWQSQPWSGVYPATLCPFHDDESIDESGLTEYITEVASVDGINGVVCNGHTGEIMSLRLQERDRVTSVVRTAVDAVNGQQKRDVKTITGVSAEGSHEAIDHAKAARDAGADAILLMPPHHWLRFGRSDETAVGFIRDVAEGAGVPIIIHQYPAWTKAGYTLQEMLEMVKIPEVVMIKMGTRDMSRWLFDYEQLKAAAPHVSIVTCHDEFLLPTLLEGADGALIGFAGFVPELMVKTVHAALDADLTGARDARETVAPLARLIYNFGEPGCGAHQRMKVARWLMGRFPSPLFRRPIRPLSEAGIQDIREQLKAIDYPVVR